MFPALANGMLLHVGKSETPLEMLKSILAQLEFQHEILEWEKKGIPFRSRVYVPKVHPIAHCSKPKRWRSTDSSP